MSDADAPAKSLMDKNTVLAEMINHPAVKAILDRHPRKDTELTLPLDRLEEAERAK